MALAIVVIIVALMIIIIVALDRLATFTHIISFTLVAVTTNVSAKSTNTHTDSMIILWVAGWEVANVDLFALVVFATLILLHRLLNVLLFFGSELILLVDDVDNKNLSRRILLSRLGK